MYVWISIKLTEDLCEIHGRDKLELPTNKVLNGNISGKEYEVKSVKTTANPNGTLTEDKLGVIMAEVTGDSLRPLGEGTFEIKISRDAGNNITLEIVDKSEFNGGKEYVMDSITFDKTTANNGDKTVEIAGLTLNLKGLENNTNIAANESATIEFSNTISKEEEGIRLQVGANREQMIGLSVGNIEEQGVRARRNRCDRSRECGGSDREDR